MAKKLFPPPVFFVPSLARCLVVSWAAEGTRRRFRFAFATAAALFWTLVDSLARPCWWPGAAQVPPNA